MAESIFFIYRLVFLYKFWFITISWSMPFIIFTALKGLFHPWASLFWRWLEESSWLD